MKVALFGFLAGTLATLATWSPRAHAVTGAELIHNESARYGKFEARMQLAPGDGVVSTFFLWKEGSEQENVFWNELDIEKVGPDCTGYSSNALYGNPESNHSQLVDVTQDLCTSYHTHTFEWTPTAIVWLLDGVEVRRLSGADLEAFEANALPGMQIRFNVWVGRPDFGGNFSPSILPVHQYINWVSYSEYTPGAGDDGSDFAQVWREDFDSPLSGDWVLGNWPSPFSNSIHSPTNVSIVDGIAVLSLTEDGVTPAVTPPPDEQDEDPNWDETGGMPGQVETPNAGNGSGGTPREPGTGGTNTGGASQQGGATQGGASQQGGQGGAAQQGGVGGQVAQPEDPPTAEPPSSENVAGSGAMIEPEPINPVPASPAESSSGGSGAVAVPPVAAGGNGSQSASGPVASAPMSSLASPTPSTSPSAEADGAGCKVAAPTRSSSSALGLPLLGLAFLGALRRNRAARTQRLQAVARRVPLTRVALLVLGLLGVAAPAGAVASAELYSPKGYRYGKFEARINFPEGDGVVASFFLWKNRSEVDSVFWNELDFEKIGADCELQLNSIYGEPESGNESTATGVIPCGVYHTYAFEWTPEYIAWLVDGTEVRRDTGADAQVYADNAAEGMQFRFNVWPGTAAFGGNFSPEILPVHEFISWVRYSEYTPGGVDGDFTLAWHESFDNGVPSNFYKGSWASPLGKSTHSSANITAVSGIAVLSLTEDGAPAFAGTPPPDSEPEPPGAPPPPVASPSATTAGEAPTETDTASSASGCSLGTIPPHINLLYPLVGLVWLIRRAVHKRHASSFPISS